MTPRLPALALALFLALPVSAQTTDASNMARPGSTPTADEAPDVVMEYQATITPQELAAHLYFFASDHFEGRETATRGQRMAAEYLAAQYRRLGVTPAGTVETEDRRSPEAYMQRFPLYGQRLKEASLTVTGADGTTMTSVFGANSFDGKSWYAAGGSDEHTAGVVFAGYGIPDGDRGYDDYAAMEAAGLDQAGKWLVMLDGEPMDSEGQSLITENGAPSEWSENLNNKLRPLFSRGLPAGILIVGHARGAMDQTVAEMAEEEAAGLGEGGNLSLSEPDGSQPSRFPPIYLIDADMADALLAGSGHTVSSIVDQIGASGDPIVLGVEGASASASIERETYETSSENVIAFIEGSDPELRDEVVIVSSHYDHIGLESQGDDRINNGADDDGSGTVAILEMAEAFMMAKQDGVGPRRSVAFLNVSGEEKGLLGSAYYADTEPVFALENTVTNLNIDMIGRIDPTHPGEDSDYVYIIGSNLISQELHDINARMNTLTGIELDLNERFNSRDDPNQFYRRSDHWNFGKHGIPFIFYFTGTHEDYHGVNDEADKIEYERLAEITRLIFATAWQVANQDARPAVSGTGFN